MESFAVTDIGKKRNTNQDSYYCSDTPVGFLPNLYVVADGMGGHRAGDYASKFCIDNFVEILKNSEDKTIIHSLENAVKETNKRIMSASEKESELEGMGTTIVAATVKNGMAYVLNVGDSRLYIIRATEIEQITQDHSLVEEMVKSGELERNKAKNHPNKNIITRALGATKAVMPDFFETPVEIGDMLLLCSDGLTNMVEDGMICEIISKVSDSLEKRVKKLLDVANANGGNDNISIIAIQI